MPTISGIRTTLIGSIEVQRSGIAALSSEEGKTQIEERIFNIRGKQVLIDNYIDDTVLTLMSKRVSEVKATIYTGKISKQLQLDIDKHNAQYPPVEVRTFSKAHERRRRMWVDARSGRA